MFAGRLVVQVRPPLFQKERSIMSKEKQIKQEQIKQEKEQYFIDENENKDRRKEGITPSGRFKLVTRYYSTKKGCWSYSRGTFYRLSDNKEIADIKRNYSHFAHSVINKNNQEWIVTGRSYMSQTIINLDTGEIFEPKGDQYDGHAFCWVGCTLSPDEKTLIVDGCYWAAPYEYKFFDFSDPSKGWPELKVYEDGEQTYQYSDNKQPDFNEDGTITCYQTSKFFIPLNKYDNDLDYETELKPFWDKNKGEYDKDENWRVDIDKKITLARQDDRMVIIDRWISSVEQERIKRRQIASEKRKQWRKEFTTSDPLYLKYKELVEDPILSPDNYESTGITHKDWCPDFKEQETRWCRRIIKKDEKQPYTVDLNWAVKTGPIKLTIFKDGKASEEKFFPHTAEAMEEAFTYAKKLLA